jgi:hypothetical protein
MTKAEAEEIMFDLNQKCRTLSIEQTKTLIAKSDYPQLANMYIDYLQGKMDIKEYIPKAIHHIQVSSTKLYKVMK